MKVTPSSVAFEDGERGLLVALMPEGHCAQANLGDLEARPAQTDGFHDDSFAEDGRPEGL